MLVERHGGKVPNTFDELEALPGVGMDHMSLSFATVLVVQLVVRSTEPPRICTLFWLAENRSVSR